MTELALFNGVRPHKIDADEYIAMVGAGVFGDADVELVDGELIAMAPSQTRHGRVLDQVYRALIGAYPQAHFHLRFDTIVKLASHSVRAPDISVVDRDIGDRKFLLPEDILLAVEISDSTLAEDIGRKCANYAAAAIRNYWVFDVEGARIHRFVAPESGRYTVLPVVPFGEQLSLPGTKVRIVMD